MAGSNPASWHRSKLGWTAVAVLAYVLLMNKAHAPSWRIAGFALSAWRDPDCFLASEIYF